MTQPSKETNPGTVAFMTLGPSWPQWLEKSASHLQDAWPGIDVRHIAVPMAVNPHHPAAPAEFAQSLTKRVDRRSWNPLEIDALMAAPYPSVSTRTVSSMEEALETLVDQGVNIVFCEQGVPLGDLLTLDNIRVFLFDETWHSGWAVSYAKAVRDGWGSASIALIECAKNADSVVWSTTSQVTPASMAAGVHFHMMKAALLPLRALNKRRGDYTLPKTAVLKLQAQTLSTSDHLKLAARQLGRRLKDRLKGRNDSAWAMAIAPDTGGDTPPSLKSFITLPCPDGIFRADPFLASDNDKTWLFFEELDLSEWKGRLRVCEVRNDGTTGNVQTVLDKDWHLSWPNVFCHEGTWYMAPESGGHGVSTLYRAIEFPTQWEPVCDIKCGHTHVYDPVFFYQDNRWWMFASVGDHGVRDYDELSLFWASDLTSGSWTPHPMNPVISDVSRARMAGQLSIHGGQLRRVAQDSRFRYGYGLVIHEIESLNTHSYQEREIMRINSETDPGNHRGIHTLNRAAGWWVVDYLRA